MYDLVRLIASVPRLLADLLRPLQNGLVQFYALAMVFGRGGVRRLAGVVREVVWLGTAGD